MWPRSTISEVVNKLSLKLVLETETKTKKFSSFHLSLVKNNKIIKRVVMQFQVAHSIF